jgi:hypothetical protein
MSCRSILLQDLESVQFATYEASLDEGTGTAVFNEWDLSTNRRIVLANDWKMGPVFLTQRFLVSSPRVWTQERAINRIHLQRRHLLSMPLVVTLARRLPQ